MEHSSDILIVGGGFGGLSCFQNIDRSCRKVNLLTNRNHFLFTPLLPLAAVGSVEVRSIVEPIYSFEKEKDEVIIGEAFDLQPEKKRLIAKIERDRTDSFHYNCLILAMGAATSTYNIPGVNENCSLIKEMKDARLLREKIIYQFEKASQLDKMERKAAVTFILVGAGPTGVETACEIYDLVRDDFSKYFPELAQETNIQIIEAGKEILLAFDRTLANYAARKLKQKGIQIKTGLQVTQVKPNQVLLDNGEVLQAETIIWAAGNGPQSFTQKAVEQLNMKLEKGGRISVDPFLKVRCKFPDIYALGDCAALDHLNRTVPATAQVAMKEGIYLGRELCRQTKKPFHFKSMGMLASLGSGRAIADLGFFQLTGILAWWFWKAAYLTRLVSLRNKASVAFDWIKVKFFGRNTARIDF